MYEHCVLPETLAGITGMKMDYMVPAQIWLHLCAFLFVRSLGMTDLFFPSRRILRELSASTPVISVM